MIGWIVRLFGFGGEAKKRGADPTGSVPVARSQTPDSKSGPSTAGKDHKPSRRNAPGNSPGNSPGQAEPPDASGVEPGLENSQERGEDKPEPDSRSGKSGPTKMKVFPAPADPPGEGERPSKRRARPGVAAAEPIDGADDDSGGKDGLDRVPQGPAGKSSKGSGDRAPSAPAASAAAPCHAGEKSRVLLQHGVEGEYVRRLQAALHHNGFDPGEIDGVFGRLTTDAIRAFGSRRGRGAPDVEPDGRVTFDLWMEITGHPVPGLFERCLQLTSSFEGYGFTKMAGNHDNGGVTWGIAGYTLSEKTLQPIVDYFIDNKPDVIREAFGPLAEELVGVMDSTLEEQKAWADQISVGTQKVRVEGRWAEAFARFGEFEEVQSVQLEEVERKYWSQAMADAERFDLKSELGAALAFDIAVQCGGIDGGCENGPEIRAILRRFDNELPETELERRKIIAEVVAHSGLPKYFDAISSRKMAIACGQGTVNHKTYHLKHWGLGEFLWR